VSSRLPAALACVVAVLGVACHGSSRPTTQRDPQTAGRFPHAAPAHLTVPCATCHPTAAVLEGVPKRPGGDDHAPCDQGKCHAAAFLRAPGPLCELCHARVDPGHAGGTVAAFYPPRRGPRALASRFGHALHLDRARMENAAGFHVSCGDCHTPVRDAGARDMQLPGHADCAPCHTGKARPDLTTCDGCHVRREADPPRTRRLVASDLRFHHALHDVDARGKTIACATCHEAQTSAAGLAGNDPPQTAVCVQCHDDPRRAPPTAVMGRCETCHERQIAGFAQIGAPRSHIGRRDRPEDHTLAFRRDHGAEAVADAQRCAGCHGTMSGSRRDNCDECHQSMRPTDHNLTWREFDHGKEAAVSTARCATCHGGEFCVACHSLPPRSHARPNFTMGGAGHAGTARNDLRACFACHRPEVECVRCHMSGFKR
jgi:predicted CXXCH cytochrome family protein